MIKDHLTHVLVSAFRYETSRSSGLTFITAKAISDNIEQINDCFLNQFKQDLKSRSMNHDEEILLDKILAYSKQKDGI